MKWKKGIFLVEICLSWFLANPSYPQSKKRLILPPGFEAKEGSSFTNFPFGRGTPFRLQDIYWKPCFYGTTRELIITSISIRPDGGVKKSGKNFVSLNLYLSSTQVPVGKAHQVFKLNRGKDFTLVFSGMLNLPPLTGKTPSDFLIKFPLEAPFIYSTDQEGLLMEFEVLRQPPGRYPLDSPYMCKSHNSGFGYSPYCKTSLGKPLVIKANPTIKVGGNISITLSGAPKGKNAIAFIGGKVSGKYLGLNLPIDLTVYGAYGCKLLTPPTFISKTRVTTEGGTCTFNFPLPSDMYYLVGFYFYTQVFIFDPIANPIGIVFSHGLKLHVCGPQPVGRVFSSGTVTAGKGWFQFGSAHIVELGIF